MSDTRAPQQPDDDLDELRRCCSWLSGSTYRAALECIGRLEQRLAAPVAQQPAITAAALIARLLEIGEVYSAKNASRVLATMAAPAEQRRVLTAALAELVACKDLKDEVDRMGYETVPTGARDAVFMRKLNEYHRRKPLAWEAARAVLAEIRAEEPKP
jgi:hypothetical protein